MGSKTDIEWTHATFNPWQGCVKISDGCDFCYAEAFSKRVGYSETGSQFPIWGKDAQRRLFGEKHWNEPLKWNEKAKREGVHKRVFCGSMCDVMEDRRDLDEHRERLYRLIEATPCLDWLLLTKRPQNFQRFLPKEWLKQPRPNVWGMTTVESQDYTWRVIELLLTPFAVRGLSMEPLLGPVDLAHIDTLDHIRAEMVKFARWNAEKHGEDPEAAAKKMAARYPKNLPDDERPYTNALTGFWFDGWDSGDDAEKLDWVIVGSESGHGARPMNEDWVRSIRDQAVAANVKLFYKQKLVKGRKVALPELDGQTWQQFPTVNIEVATR